MAYRSDKHHFQKILWLTSAIKATGNRLLVTDKLNPLINCSVTRYPSPVTHFTVSLNYRLLNC